MIKKEWDLGDNIGKVYESVQKKLNYAGYQLEDRERTIINLDSYEVTVLQWSLSSYFQKKTVNPEKGRKESIEYCNDCIHCEMCSWYPHDGCEFIETR